MECTHIQVVAAILKASKAMWDAELWEYLKETTSDNRVIYETDLLIQGFRNQLIKDYNNANDADDESEIINDDDDNESYVSLESLEKEKFKIDNHLFNNDNGWGPEYYTNTTWDNFPEDKANDNWDVPNNNNEKDIDSLWTVHTTACDYTQQEITQMQNELIMEKWVIANQPITRGKMSCYDSCDIENHHLHKWCQACQRRIDWEDNNDHQCKFGIGLGQIKPDMNPNYLINDVFWTEPEILVEEVTRSHKQHLAKIKNINKRHQNELNGNGTSRTPLIESQQKLNIGRRFKCSDFY
jgi:hypothetical protein